LLCPERNRKNAHSTTFQSAESAPRRQRPFGRSALAYDTKLEAAVEGHCHHMAIHTFFAHDAPEASITSPWTRATLCGTNASGENIYYGSTDPQAAINAFISSPGHNATFTRVGVGNYGTRWGQLFGR
jgi:uncharacterized protein YkwD